MRDTDIPTGVGGSRLLSGNKEFPDFIRDASDTFWSPLVSLPKEVPDMETKPASGRFDSYQFDN